MVRFLCFTIIYSHSHIHLHLAAGDTRQKEDESGRLIAIAVVIITYKLRHTVSMLNAHSCHCVCSGLDECTR